MADSEFYSFEKALTDLSLDEEDLKRLISAGEIRAFRDGSKMRLRADDVQRVAQDLGVPGKVGQDEAGEVLEVEEVLFSESAGDDDEGMVTTQLSEEDTLLDDDLEVVEMDEDLGDVSPRSMRSSSRPARAAAATEETQESSGVLFAAIVTTAIMIYGLAFVVSMSSGQANGLTRPVVSALGG